MAKNDIVYRLQGEDKLSPVINKTKKEIDGLADNGKRLNEIKEGFDKMANSNMTLGKKISQTRKYMDELVQSGNKNSQVYKQLAAEAQKYDKQLKEINRDIKGVKGFDLKGMMGGVTDKMGLGNVGAAIANPYVLAGAAIAGATKALYDYNAELDRSLQKTEQFTGLSGEALMQLRNGIKATADTYGKDYDTVLASVDGLMNQFGIDAQEALKIINKGFQGGADESGKMLDLIKQYSGSFKDAGISASELVAIIGNTRSGIFSEEGMQLFQKGAKNVREFSDNLKASLEGVGINAEEMYRKLQSGEISTVQAIQQISAQLKGLNPQSQEVGEVLKNVFGKVGSAAGMELVTALSEVETNLDVVAQQTGQTGEAFENLRKANEEFEAALASLFGTSNRGFSTMITQLKADLFGAVAKVINKFIDLYNESIIVRYGIQSIAIAFKNAWEIIKAILKLFMNSLKSLGGMIEGILTLDWKKVVSSWQNGVKNTLKTVADGFENIKNNIADGLDETLHGQMQKIKVSTEVEGYTQGGTSGGSTSGNKDNKNGNSDTSNKGNKVKEIIDENSIKYAQQQLQKLQDEKLNIPVDATEQLAENQKQIEYWEKEIERRKILVELNTKYADEELKNLQNELKSLFENKETLNIDKGEFENELKSLFDKKVTLGIDESEFENELKSLLENKKILNIDEFENELKSLFDNKEILNIDEFENQLKSLLENKVTLGIDEGEFEKKYNEIISKINARKVELTIETQYDDSNLNELKDRLKQLQALRYTLSPNDTETLNLLNNEIKNVEEKINDTEMKLGIKPYVDPNSLQGVNKRISEIKNELNRMDINLNPQRYAELMEELKLAEKEAEELQKKLNIKSLPSISAIENKDFEKGSLEDKRQSMANANARAEQVKSDKEAGLITAEQARAELDKIQKEIDEKFPNGGLTLDLKINEDGSITTRLEDIEKKAKDVGDTAGYIGQLGSAFSTLGSAIGGAGGEIVSFGGQVISQGAAMVAQMAQIIAANQAAALAKGIESASGLMFPFNLAAIATVVGTIASLFASLPTFETGGIVGGTSFKGDKVLARVNSGEAILNQKQQNRMMDILNGADYGSDNNGFSGGTVKFEIDGKVLKGVLNNYNNKISKQS